MQAAAYEIDENKVHTKYSGFTVDKFTKECQSIIFSVEQKKQLKMKHLLRV